VEDREADVSLLKYLPTFKEREDGNITVELYGREWGLLSEPKVRQDYEYYGIYREHTTTTAELSFRLILLDPLPKDLSIPDHIILGDN
jgi:hypothetical protein